MLSVERNDGKVRMRGFVSGREERERWVGMRGRGEGKRIEWQP